MLENQGHQLQQFSNEKTLSRIWQTMTFISMVAAVATFYFMRYGELCAETRTWISIAWFMGPPIWFFFENTFLLKPEDVEQKKERMARFRLSQDSARMCWFGIAAAIIFLARPIS